MEILWFVLFVGACVGLIYVGYVIEPHWASRDGQRFLCNGQLMDGNGERLGRWRETRVTILSGGQIEVVQKHGLKRSATTWRLASESPEPPRRRAVFLARRRDEQGIPLLIALRLPAGSRATAALRELEMSG